MILRLTVADAETGASCDIEVVAEPDSTVASLLDALPLPVRNRPCYVGRTPLDSCGVIGDGPLVSGAVLSIGATSDEPRRLLARAVGVLRSVAGPDVGSAAWLAPGRYAVPGPDVPLTDPAARTAPAELTVSSAATATWSAAGSAPRPLGAAEVVRLGDTGLEWVPLAVDPQHVARSRDGRLDFDRAFAPAPALRRAEVALPASDETPSGVTALVVSGLVPLALGVVMALVLHQPAFLLFALLGPVTALSSHLVERRRRSAARRQLNAARSTAQRSVTELVAAEERQRRLLAPDQLDVTLAALGAGRGLWPRNADSPNALLLRVGTADLPASIDLRGEPWPGLAAPILRSAPVTVDLRATGVLGVVGPVPASNALLRWLLVQLATLRSPEDLRIILIASSEDIDLAWARWLPHVDAGDGAAFPCWVGNTDATCAARIAELRELVASRTAVRRQLGDARIGEDVVVVFGGALALRHLPGMRDVLRDGPAVGVYSLCVDRQDMNECRGLCELDDTSLRLNRSRDDHPTTARPEGLGRRTAERLARALAPMRDRLTLGGAETAVPTSVRYLDLLRIAAPTAEDVRRLWATHPGPTTSVPLGVDGSGIVAVDLARQGPHTMLGGATGAGKSVLLQTLVTSLLLHNRPDELDLVLVDFKGGGAFLPFERCPHVVALIRSTGETPADVFDEAAAARVLASVRAEVRRRESLLARYGGEIDEYWRVGRREPDLATLPRLVMIFDEFARVLETSPDFLKELVNVAAKGRSLGMHLLLSTQSLQGKLSAELKNNIDLRITLRQNEPADSVEVLGVPDAAAIPGRLRGRGMILCTKDETRTPRLFQSGYLGNPPPAGGAPPARTRIVEWPALGLPRPEEPADTRGAATDQELAIAAVLDAARSMPLPPPFRPLLPALPARLALDDLAGAVTEPPPSTAVPYGLGDDPAGQRQPAACLDLAGGDRLLVAGGPQSGRTTFARSFLTSLATRFRPDEAHVYVVEHHPSGLSAYEALPHCGGVFSPAEPDRIRRLVTWLDGEVQRRKVASLTGAGANDPRIVVLVDGWEYVENRSDPTFTETSVLSMLRGVVAAGPPVGVHVVAIGGQDLLSGRLPALYSTRLLLPFPKEDTRRQHLSAGIAAPPRLPGRGVDAASGTHVQVCVHTTCPDELPVEPPRDGASWPRRFPSLPVRLPIDALLRPEPAPAPTWVPLGIGGPDLEPVGVDLFDVGPHTVLVSGPAGSGRSTAAATLVGGLREIGIGVLLLAPSRSPLTRLWPDDPSVSVVAATTLSDPDLRSAAESFAGRRYAVVVDDCEQVSVTPRQEGFADAPTLLQEIASPGGLGHAALILAGDALPILSGQRRSLMRVVNEVMTAGTRLLLTPTSPPVAREHGLPLEPDQFFAGPPGAGILGCWAPGVADSAGRAHQ